MEISKKHKKGNFKFDNAIKNSLSKYEGTEISLVREVATDVWMVQFNHSYQDKPVHYWQLERSNCSVNGELDKILVKTCNGVIYLHQVRF